MDVTASRKRRRRVAAVGLAGLIVLVVWQLWYPGRSFDPALWRDEHVADGARHDMAVRMLARDALIGKTRTEVIELLGEPIELDEFHPAPDLLVYRLGRCRQLFAMDSEWLSVILGPDGRVVRCKLWED